VVLPGGAPARIFDFHMIAVLYMYVNKLNVKSLNHLPGRCSTVGVPHWHAVCADIFMGLKSNCTIAVFSVFMGYIGLKRAFYDTRVAKNT